MSINNFFAGRIRIWIWCLFSKDVSESGFFFEERGPDLDKTYPDPQPSLKRCIIMAVSIRSLNLVYFFM